MKINVNDTTVWQTSDTIEEVSLRDRSGEAGRALVESDETVINIYAYEDSNSGDQADRGAAPVADTTGSDTTASTSGSIDLVASASTGTGTLTYLWEQVVGSAGAIADDDVAVTTATAPGTADELCYLLTVTDEEGRSDTAALVVAVS